MIPCRVLVLALLAATPVSAAPPVPGPALPVRVPVFRMAGGWISNLPLSTVLAAATVARGRPAALSPPQRVALTRYLATMSTIGPRSHPELFPHQEDAVAYLVNAYLGWSIALTEQGSAHAADALRTPFPLDGGRWTLSRIVSTLADLAPLEPRITFFLAGPGPLPPLPRAPLEAYSLQWQLADQARRTGASPGFWAFDAAGRTVRVPRMALSAPGLTGDLRGRGRRLLELAPPPPALAEAIRSACGRGLELCEVAASPSPS